ncbi:M20/M25/M40 family metallo-hydrolase [Litoribacter ruber]|uniref:M20/M25/M40 family metallo-hydrolase n=1 Tax=Litoribacter ruber TaxID=702568 RepID=UPI001BDA40BB|nr:M20/M25/M40 family metallo-hydrolase [Litoribacter ruber]MBT0811795.1 M20/M25/M40 family metallo-hydrolase [Litoribacter ruber]
MKQLIALALFLLAWDLSAQTRMINRNPEIEKMVNEVKAENLEQYVRDLVDFGTRHTLSGTQDGNRGIVPAQQYVLEKFRSFEADAGGRLSSEIDMFDIPGDGRRIPEDAEIGNVVATLKGTDPNDDRIFLISGHLDSRASDVMDAEIDAPGANDDGSGVAVVIEAARILSKMEFPATIIFMAVSGEEQGLIGAVHMAKKAKEEDWNIVAMLNNDMVGNSYSSETHIKDNTRVRVFSEGIPLLETEEMGNMRRYTNGENDSKSRQLARYIKEIGDRYVDQLEVKLIYRNDRFLRGGDHTPFAREGFTAIRMTEYNENYHYHHQDVRVEDGQQYGDLPELVDYEYLRKITAVNLATLASLAAAPSAPENVGIDVSRLVNTSTLKWEKPATGNPKGYYVLMRETDQSMWEKKFYTEDLELTVPYSKDNYFFAVQAVDEKGNESLAVFPRPLRR